MLTAKVKSHFALEGHFMFVENFTSLVGDFCMGSLCDRCIGKCNSVIKVSAHIHCPYKYSSSLYLIPQLRSSRGQKQINNVMF